MSGTEDSRAVQKGQSWGPVGRVVQGETPITLSLAQVGLQEPTSRKSGPCVSDTKRFKSRLVRDPEPPIQSV